MNRRHFLKVIGLSTLPSCREETKIHTFSSIAFGTDIHFKTHGISSALFRKICNSSSQRLAEIEALFSLYQPESAISRLNRNGFLENPDSEFFQLLHTALTISETTGGLFDPTVQPLWEYRQNWKNADLVQRAELKKHTWQTALSLVDYRKIRLNRNRVDFTKPGMAITLNGIVQGYASDEIRSLLRKAGVENALVNIGEYAALGTAPDGKPWSVEIRGKNSSRLITRDLRPNSAIAVSAGYGHVFDPEGRLHHIFHPSDGKTPNVNSTIVTEAPSATLADALSTALVTATPIERDRISHSFPNMIFTEFL
ncbi:FAD:protein FMN transferase [Luteolibacter algae]|uniref:FAD:protein FMN transferase n=1 Tax=Luteolibacter algae TaxID=454151 RepID=A0ABW5D8P7_9BACT